MTEKKNFQHIPFFCLLCLTFSVFLTGCAKKKQPADPGTGQDESQTSSNSNVSTTGTVTLDKVLRLFDDEKAEEAVEQFLKMQWSASDIFDDGSMFALSEQQFIALPQSQRTSIQAQAMSISTSLRSLASQVTNQAIASMKQKEYGLAERNLTTVCQLGETLSTTDHMDIVRSYGILLRQMSLRPLMQIYTETSQQAKLDETKAKIQKIRTERRALVR